MKAIIKEHKQDPDILWQEKLSINPSLAFVGDAGGEEIETLEKLTIAMEDLIVSGIFSDETEHDS